MTLSRDLELTRIEIYLGGQPTVNGSVYITERVVEGQSAVMERGQQVSLPAINELAGYADFLAAVAKKAKALLGERDPALADLPLYLPGAAVTKTVTEIRNREVVA